MSSRELCPWLIDASVGDVTIRGRAWLPPGVPLPARTWGDEAPIVWRLVDGVMHFEVTMVADDDAIFATVDPVIDAVVRRAGLVRVDDVDWRARAGLDPVHFLPCGAVLDTKQGLVTGDGVNPEIPRKVESDLVAIFGAERFRLGEWGRSGTGPYPEWVATIELRLETTEPGTVVPFNAGVSMPALVKEAMERHGGGPFYDDEQLVGRFGRFCLYWDQAKFPGPDSILLDSMAEGAELDEVRLEDLSAAKACAEELRQMTEIFAKRLRELGARVSAVPVRKAS